MKLHIIGGAGSGKSFIAEKLSKKYHIPHYDLDDIFWDNSADVYGVKILEEQRNRKLLEIVNQESWIIEGVYRSWVGPSFTAADKIIVLKPPLALQEERIWSRYEERKNGVVISKYKETLESVKELIAWNEKFNLISLPYFIENCDYQDKIIIFENNLDILELIDNC